MDGLQNSNGFIGSSSVMKEIYYKLERAATSEANVFITGETGTGKEICAQQIHDQSRRFKAPFIAINCAAIPSNLLESELFGHVKGAFTGANSGRDGAVQHAENGTLFLDEIGEMDIQLQSKLLRFLQCKHFQKLGSNRIYKSNIRIICATNRDPHSSIQDGLLRKDLFYRLHVVPIHLPALKERDRDVLEIAQSLLNKAAAADPHPMPRSFSPSAKRLLLEYHWPGNVRELENVIEHVCVMHDDHIITEDILLKPGNITPHNYYKELQQQYQAPRKKHHSNHTDDNFAPKPLWTIERSYIEKTIDFCQGNILKAASLLEINPSTIYRKKAEWHSN